jgi:hypothetical protein
MNFYSNFKSFFKTKANISHAIISKMTNNNSNFELKNYKVSLSSPLSLFLFSFENTSNKLVYFVNYYAKQLAQTLSLLNLKTFSFGFLYLRGLFVVLFIDACLTDDEPL